MYRRLPQAKIAELHAELGKDRLFQNLYPAIISVSNHIHDISPEEIWLIADQYLHRIAMADNDLFEIDAFPHALYAQLSDYMDDANQVHSREPQHVEQTVFLVELVILYQLTRYQRDWENHPYLKYYIAIHDQIAEHPLFEKILPIISDTNDRYEKIYNDTEVNPHDYMPYVIKKVSVLREAMKLSEACAPYLAHGYDLSWLRTFWQSMADEAKCGNSLIDDLQSNRRYTTIYGIIGMLKRQNIFTGSQVKLAGTTSLENKETVRRYISTGFQDSTSPYAKFVIGYVSAHPAKK